MTKLIQFKTLSQILGVNAQINKHGEQEFTKGNKDRISKKYNKADFNNCNEYPDSENPNQKAKKNIEDFYESFDNLIDNIKKNGFDNKYPISIGTNKVIINGAHRLMISYFYNVHTRMQTKYLRYNSEIQLRDTTQR